jgi:hypothetical protein
MRIDSIGPVGEDVATTLQTPKPKSQNSGDPEASAPAKSQVADTVTLSSAALALQREQTILAQQNNGLTPAAEQIQAQQRIAKSGAS